MKVVICMKTLSQCRYEGNGVWLGSGRCLGRMKGSQEFEGMVLLWDLVVSTHARLLTRSPLGKERRLFWSPVRNPVSQMRMVGPGAATPKWLSNRDTDMLDPLDAGRRMLDRTGSQTPRFQKRPRMLEPFVSARTALSQRRRSTGERRWRLICLLGPSGVSCSVALWHWRCSLASAAATSFALDVCSVDILMSGRRRPPPISKSASTALCEVCRPVKC